MIAPGQLMDNPVGPNTALLGYLPYCTVFSSLTFFNMTFRDVPFTEPPDKKKPVIGVFNQSAGGLQVFEIFPESSPEVIYFIGEEIKAVD